MPGLARFFLSLGAILVLLGLLVAATGRFNLPLGRLPGDLSWRGRNWNVFFPLGTSLLLSLILSLVLWGISRLR